MAVRPSLAVCVLVVALQAVSTSLKAAPSYSDGMVRAAVVFGILRFTSWPSQEDILSNINLCAYGDSETIRAIEQLDPIPSIGKIKVRYLSVGHDNLNDCHALILGDGLLEHYLDTGTLLICDECDASSEDRSSIVLNTGGARVQFHVNLDRVTEQGLKLNSSLIELAASCTSTDPDIRGCE